MFRAASYAMFHSSILELKQALPDSQGRILPLEKNRKLFFQLRYDALMLGIVVVVIILSSDDACLRRLGAPAFPSPVYIWAQVKFPDDSVSC